MINRILYWFITLPVFGKVGCLMIIALIGTCTTASAISVPVRRARLSAEATQVAINTAATEAAATERANATNTALSVAATQQASTTSLALSAAATQTAIVQQDLATKTAQAGATATAQTIATATSVAIAEAATATAHAAATATALAKPTPTQVVPVEYKELKGFINLDRAWIPILISPGMDDATLIRLAHQLHEKRKHSGYYIFDDASQVDQFVNATVNYPNYPYPESWANQHFIATISQFAVDKKLKWQIRGENRNLVADIN